LFLALGNRFFVLLSVLLNLSPGLIGRDILRLGQSISSFYPLRRLLSGVSESAARTAVAGRLEALQDPGRPRRCEPYSRW